MRFTIDDKRLIKCMWVKNMLKKHLLQMFLTEDMKSWWGKDIDLPEPDH